jgi:hypothetical protein
VYLHEFEQTVLPAAPKSFVMDVFEVAPSTGTPDGGCVKYHMDMGVPLKVTAEGVQYANEAGGKAFGFVNFAKPKKRVSLTAWNNKCNKERSWAK